MLYYNRASKILVLPTSTFQIYFALLHFMIYKNIFISYLNNVLQFPPADAPWHAPQDPAAGAQSPVGGQSVPAAKLSHHKLSHGLSQH